VVKKIKQKKEKQKKNHSVARGGAFFFFDKNFDFQKSVFPLYINRSTNLLLPFGTCKCHNKVM